jgi:hypothetical protein
MAECRPEKTVAAMVAVVAGSVAVAICLLTGIRTMRVVLTSHATEFGYESQFGNELDRYRMVAGGPLVLGE